MDRLINALLRAGKAALPVLAVGPGYAAYLGFGGRGGMPVLEEALPLIRLSFWCSLVVFAGVLNFWLLRRDQCVN